MNLKYSCLILLGAIALGTAAWTERSQKHGFVVHEWGTFTSFQGGDGNLMTWRPLVTAELPKFVYNWMTHPDLDDRYSLMLLMNKGAIQAEQRMETPVVYFYSNKEQTVDLSVKFSAGFITEWYPRASQIGPSMMNTNYRAAPSTLAPQTQESLVRWANLRVLPAAQHAEMLKSLPEDAAGSHYFAARNTDSDYLRMDNHSNSGQKPELEKFLFYRGVGNFGTPLRVTMKSDDAVNLANTGRETMSHLFVLTVNEKGGDFAYVAQLLPGETKTVARLVNSHSLAPAALTARLSKEMERTLVKEGLYPREASAMVSTWESSWFAEQGTRVLYVLPRAWTDHTLSMTLSPAPRELTRVMVGRAEIFTPSLEQKLVTQLNKARVDDTAAISEVHQIMQSLGRFAEPAFNDALAKTGASWNGQAKLLVELRSVPGSAPSK